VPFKLFDYQKDLVLTYWQNRQVIAMCSRQLGKTETAASFMLWFATFQKDVNILIAANNFRAATEIMDRIKFSYEELPDWLKAGVVTYNVQKIVFDNGSKIESATTTPSTGRGKSISSNC
jgi:phage terminase large subunit-like protein